MHTPRKRFGQHFLCDQAIIQQIVFSIAPKPGEHLIEIGPGQGAMTLPILKIAKQLEAIELDRDLIPALQERTHHAGELRVHSADALSFDFASLKKDERLLRIIGNLPYNISTPLLFHLLEFAPIVADMLFMLQKEVADRIAALPDTDDYGRLSVMVQYHCQAEVLFDVPPSAFHPPPKVDSSIIKLIPYHVLPYPADDYKLFSSIVKLAFGQRRKTLRNSLKGVIDAEKWEKIAVSSILRPEVLSVKEFVTIANAMSAV